MKITVKSIINSESCTVDVQETTKINEIKQMVEKALKIPQNQQTLVLYGKTLQDDQTVNFYPTIKENTKLYLAVKKPETFDTILTRFLRQYYNEQQCEKIASEFMKDFYVKVRNLSLDDLERIAKADMHNNCI